MSNRLAQIKTVYDTANPNVNKGTKAEETVTKAIPDSERAGNRATYLYNKVLEGVGSTLSGLGDLAIQGASAINTGVLDASPVTRKLYRESIAPDIRTYLKESIGAKTDKGLEARYNNETITSALGGVFNSAPAMLTTAASGGVGTMAMFAQSFDNAIESINQSEDGRNLDEATKSFFAGGVGIATALLEKYSFDKIFKGETGLIGNAIAKRALRNASEETGGKVTGDVFSKFLDKEIIDLTSKYVKGGARLLDASLVEYATEASQEAVQAGAELLVNKETGKPVFDTSETSTWNGFLNRINKAGVAGAIGGLFMGGLSMGISNLAGVKPSVVEESQSRLDDINNALENENVSDAAKDVLVQEKIKIQDEAQKIADKVDEAYSKLDDKQKERVNEIVEEKAKLQEVLSDENVPDSVKENITKQDEALNKELSEIKPVEDVKTGNQVEDSTKQKEPVKTPINEEKLYHGSPVSGLTELTNENAGSNTNIDSARKGIWLSTDQNVASTFRDWKNPIQRGKNGDIYQVKLNVENPLYTNEKSNEAGRNKAIAEAEKNGNDSVVFTEEDGSKNVFVFDPKKTSIQRRNDINPTKENLVKIADAFTKRFGIESEVITRDQANDILKGKNSKDVFFQILDDVDVFDSKDINTAKSFIDKVFNTVENESDAKKAYKKLAIKYHPDKLGSEEVMKHLNDVNDRYKSGKLKPTIKSSSSNKGKTYSSYQEWSDDIFSQFMRDSGAASDYTNSNYETDFENARNKYNDKYKWKTTTDEPIQKRETKQEPIKKDEPVKKDGIIDNIKDFFRNKSSEEIRNKSKEISRRAEIDKNERTKEAVIIRDKKLAEIKAKYKNDFGEIANKNQRVYDSYYEKIDSINRKYYNELKRSNDLLSSTLKMQKNNGDVAGFYDKSLKKAFFNRRCC